LAGLVGERNTIATGTNHHLLPLASTTSSTSLQLGLRKTDWKWTRKNIFVETIGRGGVLVGCWLVSMLNFSEERGPRHDVFVMIDLV